MFRKKIKIILVLFFLSFSFKISFFLPVYAQTKNVLSITPPLIKNNVEPGQTWKSYIKVVNNNDNPIDVYITLKKKIFNLQTNTVSFFLFFQDGFAPFLN